MSADRPHSAEFRKLRARCNRLSLLCRVSRVIHSTLEPQKVLQLIVRQAVRVTRASSGSVVLINPTNGFLEIHAAHGLPPTAAALQLRVGEGITGWVAKTGQPARVDEVDKDPRYIMLRPQVRSELAVPLIIDRRVRGVLNVDSDRPRAFTPDDQHLLSELARQAAEVIAHTWLYEQLRRRLRLFEALLSVSQSINSTLNLDDVLRAITREAASLLDAKLCSLLLLDQTHEWLDLRASWGAGSAYLAKPRLSVADSLLGTVVRRRKPLQVDNVQVDSRYQQLNIARQEGLVSLLSVPLSFRHQALGVLCVYTDKPHRFSNEETRALEALAQLSALAIEKAQLYERVVDLEEQLRRNEKLSALGLLAAEVAHEIRNPLTVIQILFHSLDLRFPHGDPRAKDVQVITDKISDLNRILERILDFARCAEPKLIPLDINQLLDELSLLTRHKLAHHNVRLIRRLAPNLPSILADPAQLSQAFLNLTLNALEAMPDGGKLTITTRVASLPDTAPTPTHIAVEFRDTGHGMTPDRARHAFSSLLSTSKPHGTGLGLPIVARIAEAHQAKLQLTSKPGRGATVRLLLPIQTQTRLDPPLLPLVAARTPPHPPSRLPS